MENDEEADATSEQILVRVCKYDGMEHRRWHARLKRRENSLLVFDAEFAETVQHAELGTIERGTISTEYYWLDRWYNVFRFATPSGELRNFYCNINQPPAFDGRTLTYVDLDIDVLVAPDLSYTILDQDEFNENFVRYNYPVDLSAQAWQALSEVIELIEARGFPFSEH